MGVTAGRTPDLAARFAAVRALTRAQPQLSLLHIGAQDTQWLVGRGDRPDAALTLPLGTARTSQPFFRHDPPTPLELEQAIDAVEDALSRARGLPAGPTLLATTDAAVHALARAVDPAGGTARITLARESVEALFQRLASAALGQPGALAGMPAGREAAATLLILREVMHHLGHASIDVIPAAADTGA